MVERKIKKLIEKGGGEETIRVFYTCLTRSMNAFTKLKPWIISFTNQLKIGNLEVADIRMDLFTRLPEDCISVILSHTSPLEASKFAVISKGFNSAAESDAVWERFLPCDYQEILSRSVSPVVYGRKKDLYFSLCDSPILLDGGTVSFFVEKKSGKTCVIVGAKELAIAWGDTPWYWEWISHTESRFAEVALLISVSWLDIRGKIKTQMLSPNTTYGAYLIFKLAEHSYGLESAMAYVRLVNNEAHTDAEERAGIVHLQPPNGRYRNRQRTGLLPVNRSDDGWMEIELGSFYNDRGDDGEAEARLIEIKQLHGKTGLIVEGIEFRPKLDTI